MDHRPVILWICLIAGCGGAGTAEPVVEDSPYYPLRVGSKWIYQGPEHQRVLTVTKHVKMEGKPAAVVETRTAGKLVAVEHLHADKNGLFILAIGNKPLTKPLPFLRLPPTPGRTWKINIIHSDESQIFQTGKDHVTVPYGSFDAVTLRTDLHDANERKLSNFYWFAKDVGIVKQVLQTGDSTTTYELVEFVKGN